MTARRRDGRDGSAPAIGIHAGGLAQRYHALCEVRARVTGRSIYLPAPTIASVNAKLRARAVEAGATAIVDVRYRRGASATSWRALTAIGTAVILEAPPRDQGTG